MAARQVPSGMATESGRRAVLAGLAAVIVAALGLVAVVSLRPDRPEVPTLCRGVGLIGPEADTARGALAAWISANEGQPPASAWEVSGTERLKARVVVAFTNPRYASRGDEGYWRVAVSRPTRDPATGSRLEGEPWRADGACV